MIRRMSGGRPNADPNRSSDRRRAASRAGPEMDVSQCRAARGLLGWTQSELAKKASVGLRTVAAFERGEIVNAVSLQAIAAAFVDANVVFVDDTRGRGVLLARAAKPTRSSAKRSERR